MERLHVAMVDLAGWFVWTWSRPKQSQDSSCHDLPLFFFLSSFISAYIHTLYLERDQALLIAISSCRRKSLLLRCQSQAACHTAYKKNKINGMIRERAFSIRMTAGSPSIYLLWAGSGIKKHSAPENTIILLQNISLLSLSCFHIVELSLDLYTHTQCTRFGMWNKHIMVTVNRVPPCLEQVELAPTEYSREGNIHLRVSERYAQTAPRAPSEAHHVARQITAVGRFGFMEPSLRSEREAVREQLFVMGNREVGHGDHGTGGKNI